MDPETHHGSGQKQHRKRRVTKLPARVDRRTQVGRRALEIADAMKAEIGGPTSVAQQVEIQRAAELSALAERARGDLMRSGRTLEDGDFVLRLEGAADRAARRAMRRRGGRGAVESLSSYLARSRGDDGPHDNAGDPA